MLPRQAQSDTFFVFFDRIPLIYIEYSQIRKELTGIFIDTAEERLVIDRIPTPSDAEYLSRLRRAVGECNRFGLVAVHDAGITRRFVGAMNTLHKQGGLTLRVYGMVDADKEVFLEECFAAGPHSEAGGRLVIRSIKVYADGALGSRGAALDASPVARTVVKLESIIFRRDSLCVGLRGRLL